MASIDARDRVVAGTDGSDHAALAVDWAADWAEDHSHGLTLLLVTPPLQLPSRGGSVFRAMREGHFLDEQEKAAQAKLHSVWDRVSQRHPELDVQCETFASDAAAELVKASITARLVVVGSRGRGAVRGALLGSVAESVITHGQGPVVVVPPRGSGTAQGPVVVGVDTGQQAHEVLSAAVAEAVHADAELRVLHAWHLLQAWSEVSTDEPDDVYNSLRDMLADLVRPHREAHPNLIISPQLEIGPPEDVLVEASRSASLVVTGSRGRGGFAGLLLGSTSRFLVRHSDCPVLVIPTEGRDEDRPID